MLLPSYLIDRPAETHKGHYGHALLIAGSYGKMGAAVLSARACLRSGVGLLTVHVPKSGAAIMQTAVPEAMLSIDPSEERFTALPADLHRFDAIACGPGLGTHTATTKALGDLLRERRAIPLVLDADALNILAQHPEWRPLLRGAMLTPHAIEFQRLFGAATDPQERLALQQRMASALQCHILHKGHRSTVASPDGALYANTTGNPGMATAGSGDVLTGITLALAAQRSAFERHGLPVEPHSVLAAAVYLHGKSGDLAAQKQSIASITASDIIENLKYAIH